MITKRINKLREIIEVRQSLLCYIGIFNEILLCLFIIGAYEWGRYFFEIMLK